jgi:hypothetical protein
MAFKAHVEDGCSPAQERIALEISECECTISSLSSESIDYAKDVLCLLQDKVVRKSVDITLKAQIDWLGTDEGQYRFLDVTKRFKTVGLLSANARDNLLSKIKLVIGDIAEVSHQVSHGYASYSWIICIRK